MLKTLSFFCFVYCTRFYFYFFSYAYSHRTNRMWRKNRSPNRGIGALLNPCWGVDLNRNFGYQWGSSSIFNQVGGTHLPCLETYSGPKAWSELETRAIRDFVLAHRDIEVTKKLTKCQFLFSTNQPEVYMGASLYLISKLFSLIFIYKLLPWYPDH